LFCCHHSGKQQCTGSIGFYPRCRARRDAAHDGVIDARPSGDRPRASELEQHTGGWLRWRCGCGRHGRLEFCSD
jgi:hypothetical protein